MTQIPSGTKFVGISSTVPTPENRSAQNNSTTEIYTLADLQESVLDLTTPPNDGDVLTYDTGTNAPVWSAPTGGSPTTTVVNISSAQILNMGSSPIELLPAPGVGKYYEWSVILEYTHVATPYTIADLYLYLDSPFVLISKQFIATSGNKVIKMSSDSVDSSESVAGVAYKFHSSTNAALVLSTYDSNNPTLGDGTMRAIITYTERTFGA